MTGIAIYYHPESHQAGGGESCSSELGMDILMPSLRAVPHFSSSCGSCKPTDEYPHSALRGSSWDWDQWGCCQQNHWSWCFLMAQPLNGVHTASELAVVLQVQVQVQVCVCVCPIVESWCVCSVVESRWSHLILLCTQPPTPLLDDCGYGDIISQSSNVESCHSIL